MHPPNTRKPSRDRHSRRCQFCPEEWQETVMATQLCLLMWHSIYILRKFYFTSFRLHCTKHTWWKYIFIARTSILNWEISLNKIVRIVKNLFKSNQMKYINLLFAVLIPPHLIHGVKSELILYAVYLSGVLTKDAYIVHICTRMERDNLNIYVLFGNLRG